MKFDVVINTDDKYLQHAMAMLCSLFENNKEHGISVHVLMKCLSDKSQNYIIDLSRQYGNEALFYSVNEEILEGVQFRKNRPLSMTAYYRLLLSSILPRNIDHVLYLDCDMIVMRDIKEIFEIEINNYALAATLDTFPYSQQHRLQLHMEVGERTFCSGIMLVNLDYWRKNNVEPYLLEYAKRHRKEVYLHDQDVLNYYFKKKWFLLPPKWNHRVGNLRSPNIPIYKKFDRIDYALNPMIYHYAAFKIKPWYNAPTPEKKLYTKYLKLSGYKDLYFEKKPSLFYISMVKRTLKYELKKIIQRILISAGIPAY